MPLQGWSEEMSDKNNLKNDSRKDWTEASPRPPYEGFVGRKLKVKGPYKRSQPTPHGLLLSVAVRSISEGREGERETGSGAFCVHISPSFVLWKQQAM